MVAGRPSGAGFERGSQDGALQWSSLQALSSRGDEDLPQGRALLSFGAPDRDLARVSPRRSQVELEGSCPVVTNFHEPLVDDLAVSFLLLDTLHVRELRIGRRAPRRRLDHRLHVHFVALLRDVFLLLLLVACEDERAQTALLLDQANVEWVDGQTQKAISLYKNLLEQFPNEPETGEALFRLGEIYHFSLGKPKQ